MAETETGWTKTRPDADGDYFSRIDEHDKSPVPIRIADEGAVYEFGQGGDLRREYAAEDYEYLGPFTAADFEQLTRLREAAKSALPYIREVRGYTPSKQRRSNADKVIQQIKDAIGKETK